MGTPWESRDNNNYYQWLRLEMNIQFANPADFHEHIFAPALSTDRVLEPTILALSCCDPRPGNVSVGISLVLQVPEYLYQKPVANV